MASGPAPDVYVKLSRDYAELEPIVHSIRELRKAEADLEGAEALLADPESDAEMKELAQLERDELTGVVDELTQKVRVGLLPKDKADSHDVILEVRAGTVVMRLRYLLAICSACISVLLITRAGKLK